MKAEELMIGDWYIWEAEGKKYYFQVTKETFASPEYDISNFQPVPLTVEILEKNGFFKLGKQYDIWSMKNFSFSLHLIDGVFGYYEQGHPCHPTFVTKYAHQLQHTLKLFGIEKEITL